MSNLWGKHQCPAWLKYNEKTKSFEKIPDRCKVIKRIFELAKQGCGKRMIAKILNKQELPAWKGKNGWFDSYIYKILTSRTVIGELQPHRKVGNRREPIGEGIKDYYPKVIEENFFNQVQTKIRRRTNKGGRNSQIQNLFSGLLKCAYCGSSIVFVDKGKPPKGGKYLYCDGARRGRKCSTISERYSDVEKAFLIHCNSLDINSLTTEEGGIATRRKTLLTEIEALLAEYDHQEKRVERWELVVGETDDKALKDRAKLNMQKALELQRELRAKRTEIEISLSNMVDDVVNVKDRIKEIRELIQALSEKSADALFDLRLKLRAQIQQIVDHIECAPLGSSPDDKGKKRFGMADRRSSSLKVYFKTGAITWIKPSMPEISGLTWTPKKGFSGLPDASQWKDRRAVHVDEFQDRLVRDKEFLNKEIEDMVQERIKKKKRKS